MSEIEFNPIEGSDIKLSTEIEVDEVYPFVYTVVKENFDMNFLDIRKPSALKKIISLNSESSKIQYSKTHKVDINLWPAGEDAAAARLSNFLELKATDYNQSRK